MDSNSTSRAQELAGVSSGTRGLSRNNSRNATSAPQHERRKSIRLLGNVVELDEWLDWRVKWGQRGAAVGAQWFHCRREEEHREMVYAVLLQLLLKTFFVKAVSQKFSSNAVCGKTILL